MDVLWGVRGWAGVLVFALGVGGWVGCQPDDPSDDTAMAQLPVARFVLSGDDAVTTITFEYEGGLLVQAQSDNPDTPGIELEYDDQRRLTSLNYDTGERTFEYDATGLIATETRFVTNDNGDVTTSNERFEFEWDERSKLVRSESQSRLEKVENGIAGPITTRAFTKSGSTEYVYRSSGDIESLESISEVVEGGETTELRLDAWMEYSDDDFLTSVSYVDQGGGTIFDGITRTRSFRFTSDERLSRVESSESSGTNFSYDDVGRITDIQYTGGQDLQVGVEYDDDLSVSSNVAVGVPSTYLRQRILSADLGGDVVLEPQRHIIGF